MKSKLIIALLSLMIGWVGAAAQSINYQEGITYNDPAAKAIIQVVEASPSYRQMYSQSSVKLKTDLDRVKVHMAILLSASNDDREGYLKYQLRELDRSGTIVQNEAKNVLAVVSAFNSGDYNGIVSAKNRLIAEAESEGVKSLCANLSTADISDYTAEDAMGDVGKILAGVSAIIMSGGAIILVPDALKKIMDLGTEMGIAVYNLAGFILKGVKSFGQAAGKAIASAGEAIVEGAKDAGEALGKAWIAFKGLFKKKGNKKSDVMAYPDGSGDVNTGLGF